MGRTLIAFAALIVLLWFGTASARVDLVTLPQRDGTRLTIYKAADLTLVRERRELTFMKGDNRLQFSWANTLIDPTSLEMAPMAHADRIDVMDLSFPPRVSNAGVWNVRSEIAGNVPVEITYLTSGLTWRAFYLATLDADETVMHLQGYVRVVNDSGEDYDSAQVRLIVGNIHLIDRIAELARRDHPYGRPLPPQAAPGAIPVEDRARTLGIKHALAAEVMTAARPKEIARKGLSEYYLYTIEGTETLPTGWAKRLPSFDVRDIPVKNLYKYEEERFGPRAVRFLSFTNSREHRLGHTPIPGGTLKVYRTTRAGDHLSYEGASRFKYIPVDEDVELSLGPVDDVMVEPTLMDDKTDRYLFDFDGNISGWDEIRTVAVRVKNTRARPATVELTRNIPTSSWDIEPSGRYGVYRKVDLDTVRFTLSLDPRETRTFTYVLTTRHGQRARR